jgi:hypothetical protein
MTLALSRVYPHNRKTFNLRGFMACNAAFRLFSSTGLYHVQIEDYDMPCQAAIDFLHQLDCQMYSNAMSASLSENQSFPQHRVLYQITNGEENYQQDKAAETPCKAAAKIALFMKKPKLMPKN